MRATRSGHPGLRALGPATMAMVLIGALLAPSGVLASGLAPTPVNDTPTVAEDTQLVVNVLANDSDPEGDPLTISSAAPISATYGTGGWNPDGTLTFTPKANWSGTVPALWYRAHDGSASTMAWVTITVTPVNDAPVAVDDTVTVVEDTATVVTATILGNDTDTEGDTRSVTAVASPTGGTVAVAAGVVTFTPTANLCGVGAGSFDYTVSDGSATDTGHASVDLTCVNDAPVAAADTATGTEDTDAVIAEATLLANDTDAEGSGLLVDGVANPAHGTVDLLAGTITFTPTAQYCGAATFEYRATDGDDVSGWTTVTVSLACVNDGGPVAVDDTVTVVEDAPTDVTGDILSNDTDIDPDVLSVSAVANPIGGSVAAGTGSATFTPTANLCGVGAGSFDYTVSDGTATDTGHVTVDLTCVNDAPVAVDDTVTVVEDTATVVTATILGNDTDTEGDTRSVTAVASPTGGTVAVAAGVVTFTPTANLCGVGAGSFDYTVSDGSATDTGHASVDLTCVNDAPVAAADTASVAFQSGAADHDVLDNDTDVDGDALTVSAPSILPAGAGTVAVSGNQVRYTPAPGYTGQAVITYTVSDGTLTDTGTLTVTVLVDAVDPVPAVPTVAFGTGRVNESAPLRISWSATDTNGSGVASYEVQVKTGTGAWTAFYAGTATSMNASFAFRTDLQWRVRATDGAGNVSEWATSGVRRLVAYQGGPRVTFTGTWSQRVTAAASGSGFRSTTTKGSRVALAFTGMGVMFVAPRVADGGYAIVKTGGTVTRVRLRSDPMAHGQIIRTFMWASSGAHSIRVINDQGGRRTTFDAFVVLQ